MEELVGPKEILIVVDSEARRRASLSRDLIKKSYHAEPCDSLADYTPALPSHGTLLVHDDDNALTETISTLRRRKAWLPIVAYRDQPQPSQIVDALNLGVLDYLVWPFEISALADRLEKLKSRFALHFELRSREKRAQRKLETLSKREREVLDGIVDGNTNKAIAEELSISPRTVEIHRRNAIRKMGANSTAEAVKVLTEGASTTIFDNI